MIASRRALRARYEFRFGASELAALASGLTLVCAVTFVVGLLVGRTMAPAGDRSATVTPATPQPVEATPAAPRARAEDRLTFYKTLTAPSMDLPSVGPPGVEEHLVPRGEPTESSAPKGADSPAPKAVESPPTSQPRVARERSPTPPAAARTPPTPARGHVVSAGGVGTALPPPLWTVQVSSFRSRALADDLRARLAARGFDAYLVPVATEEGRVRYRVRVGAFATRGEAERVAGELRAERTLSPFVTPRAR